MTITDHTTRTSRALAVAIVIVILALLAAALYTSHEDRALRKVEIAFLGFTNSSTSPEALFALTSSAAAVQGG